MGDLALQTSVEPAGEGRYRAMVDQDWEIWGPCGGYVAAIALRAAGAESPFARPASFFCHYLSVAAFAPVDLVVTPLRSGRTVLAQRVEMTQDGRPVLDGMVWSVGQVEGLEHVDLAPPGGEWSGGHAALGAPPARRRRGGGQGRRPAALCVLGQLRTATG
jgi:acyl-CoA thioesterase II